MASIWILGAGHFGKRTLQILSRHGSHAIRVIDKDPARIDSLLKSGTTAVCGDAVDYLVDHLDSVETDLWIVPAVPIHVAWEYVSRMLGKTHHLLPLELAEAILARLPNPMKGDKGAIYASHATFRCPDDCPEPATHCTHTGLPRPQNLYELIEDLKSDLLRAIVVRSRQIDPGVGGYTPEALLKALQAVRSSSGKPVLLATSCRCHGVLHAFTLARKDPNGSP